MNREEIETEAGEADLGLLLAIASQEGIESMCCALRSTAASIPSAEVASQLRERATKLAELASREHARAVARMQAVWAAREHGRLA